MAAVMMLKEAVQFQTSRSLDNEYDGLSSQHELARGLIEIGVFTQAAELLQRVV
jgi:hypothetical protein